MKEGNSKLTISVDKRVKALFKELCDEEGLKIGKQLELYMKKELEKRGKKEDDG
ncbi:hypothetical protein GF351_02805 [Candidatus Woesearchaeota archaeon]|nr:hypothetical protein [Candidatus Woesearchaeota archaeon]